jgi:hypothetical protein
VAIHDIDVQHGGASALDFGDIFAQSRKIGREDAGEDFDHAELYMMLAREGVGMAADGRG